jgi:hypothetical protein
MGGAPIGIDPTTKVQQSAVTIYTQPNPFPPSKLSVFVFEDDFPLNGEQDAGGGIDVLATNEPGLGGFNITLFDDAGGTGGATGQMTCDMFNQPLSNSLAGTLDPATRLDACPISKTALTGVDSTNGNALNSPSATGITGTIVTCPKYEADGATLSPLAGQAVVANLMPGRYGWSRPRLPTESDGVKSGSRPTPWTARRPTIRSFGSVSLTSSRNLARPGITLPSALRIPRLSMVVKLVCAMVPTPTSPTPQRTPAPIPLPAS